MARETIEVANATQSVVSLPLHLATPHRFALVYTGIRVVDTCIVEDHFAKFHVLEAELHLLTNNMGSTMRIMSIVRCHEV